MFILYLSLTVVLITVIVQWLQNIMILNYAQIYLMTSKWTKTFAHIYIPIQQLCELFGLLNLIDIVCKTIQQYDTEVLCTRSFNN